jgi:hypothetical protein
MPQTEDSRVLEMLSSNLYSSYKRSEYGLLFKAIQLVAGHVGRDGRLLAKSCGALKDASLHKDQAALERLGFQDIISWTISTRVTCRRLIPVAATIILFSDCDRAIRPISLPTEPRRERTLARFTLALVLKGIDLFGAQPDHSLSADEVTTLVERSNYFACRPEKEMADALRRLQLGDEGVNRESEAEVLVTIGFEHYDGPPSDGFATKLQLSRYLEQGARGFAAGRLQTLLQSSGLSKQGFVSA